jgi:2-hydroxymuconate-semialdehyde hydrolase
MFPAPRQQHIDDLVVPDDALAHMTNPALVLHRRDDGIVRLETSLYHFPGHLPHATNLQQICSFSERRNVL